MNRTVSKLGEKESWTESWPLNRDSPQFRWVWRGTTTIQLVNTGNRIRIAAKISEGFTLLLPSFTYMIPSSLFEPPHDKTNKMVCAPSEDSDQPGHPPSLIWVLAVSMKKAWAFSAQLRLIRLGGCLSWPESLLSAHVILSVLSWGCSFSCLLWRTDSYKIVK